MDLSCIYFREQRGAVIGVHLGWLWFLAGVNFAYWRQADDPHWSWPFLVTGLLLQGLYFLYRFYLEPRHAWVRRLLTEPTRLVLKSASLVLAVVCIIALCDGAEMDRLQWLYAFVAAQLAWHALKTRHVVFGAVLFFHIWIGLLAVTAPGSGMLWLRVSISQSLTHPVVVDLHPDYNARFGAPGTANPPP